MKELYSMMPILEKRKIHIIRKESKPLDSRFCEHDLLKVILPKTFLHVRKVCKNAFKRLQENPKDLSNLKALQEKHEELRSMGRRFCSSVQKAIGFEDKGLCDTYESHFNTPLLICTYYTKNPVEKARLEKAKALICPDSINRPN